MERIIFGNSHLEKRQRQLVWTTTCPAVGSLRRDSYYVLNFCDLKKQVLAWRATGTSRSSLGNPAAAVLSIFQRHERLALLGVTCDSAEDLQILYGYVVEPAFRHGCTLWVVADRHLADVPILPDPQWRCSWTRDRLMHLAELGKDPCEVLSPATVSRWQRWWRWLTRRGKRRMGSEPETETRLDEQQRAAVRAGDGVVQVIAPAGSGKTTVLIERVKELQRRGTAAERILCMSFNRDAKVEIGDRLQRAGVLGAVVRSFHGMGLAILKAEGRLRAGIGSVADADLGRMIAEVLAETAGDQRPGGEAAPDSAVILAARNAISAYKLAAMVTPDEAGYEAGEADPQEQLQAQVYRRYEEELARREVLDFDDLVAGTVRLLQTDAVVRARWQGKFDRVLVDEYQDIEPSQALLVGLLAAPQDSLFCVGDEDQCIYAWRRATVQRIIELDQVYPGLERHALVRNYRCARRITEASRRLITHNRVRFRKPLLAGARDKGEIVLGPCQDRAEGAALVAHLISDAVPGEVVVLARTGRLLAEVAEASERRGQPFPQVELATIHGAKGREWERVILFGADEGQTPHGAAGTESEVEDERRLFYVALTRAKSRLEIICTAGRESRFLREAGLL